jgi:hypothetical protein
MWMKKEMEREREREREKSWKWKERRIRMKNEKSRLNPSKGVVLEFPLRIQQKDMKKKKEIDSTKNIVQEIEREREIDGMKREMNE